MTSSSGDNLFKAITVFFLTLFIEVHRDDSGSKQPTNALNREYE